MFPVESCPICRKKEKLRFLSEEDKEKGDSNRQSELSKQSELSEDDQGSTRSDSSNFSDFRDLIVGIYDVVDFFKVPGKDRGTEQEGVFHCRACKRDIVDILPVNKRIRYRLFNNLWKAGKALFFYCFYCGTECNVESKECFPFLACARCEKDHYTYIPANLNLRCEGDVLILNHKCVCNKKIRANLNNIFLKTDEPDINQTVVILNQRLLRNMDKNMIERNVLKPGNSSRPVNGFLIACSKKCVGKYERIFLKNVAKYIWTIRSIKFRCLGCGKLEFSPFIFEREYYCKTCEIVVRKDLEKFKKGFREI